MVYGEPSQVDNTPAIINFNCLDECPNKCLNKDRLEYWDDPSNGYKRDDKTISLTCPPSMSFSYCNGETYVDNREFIDIKMSIYLAAACTVL